MTDNVRASSFNACAQIWPLRAVVPHPADCSGGNFTMPALSLGPSQYYLWRSCELLILRIGPMFAINIFFHEVKIRLRLVPLGTIPAFGCKAAMGMSAGAPLTANPYLTTTHPDFPGFQMFSVCTSFVALTNLTLAQLDSLGQRALTWPCDSSHGW